jgi:mRNA-degrading endonuclease RelE of RelBE toxin-antitoxin system
VGGDLELAGQCERDAVLIDTYYSGSADSLRRLRVGNHRLTYDLLDPERVLLVLGIVDRKDLETWLCQH